MLAGDMYTLIFSGGCQVFVEVGVGGGWRVVNTTIVLRRCKFSNIDRVANQLSSTIF